jgi:ubiquinone/menaquinone biosynthesis C-methylase UbiE
MRAPIWHTLIPTAGENFVMGYYRERIFPWLLDHAVTGKEIEAIRDRVAGRATGHVIEIGSGTGANLLSYSESITSLTTVDPNPGMNKRARRRLKYLEFPVDTRELGCEELPMKDASFDCGVTTLTLCSLVDVEKCLGEIYRVLKPGGRLLFLEHGLSDVAAVGRWQGRITPLQRHVCDGCHLNRPIDALIGEAGFAVEEMTNYYLEKVPRVFGYMYEGVAVK